MAQSKARRRRSNQATSSAHESPEHENGASQPVPTTLLRLHLTLKGRLIKLYTFTNSQDEIRIGRDPAADIFLDNPGVSRSHARISRTSAGWTLEDLASANGTFVNDEQITSRPLYEGDVIRVGKFTINCVVELDRRGDSQASPRLAQEAVLGTTVLSGEELARMLKMGNVEPAAVPMGQSSTSSRSSVSVSTSSSWTTRKVVVFLVSAFAFGVVFGAGSMWLLFR
jgi:pSer/pThr/pTyr-binding forkhead associated (FHA) protein